MISLYPKPLGSQRYVLQGWLPELFREHDNDFLTIARIMRATDRSLSAIHTQFSRLRAAGALEQQDKYPKTYRFTDKLWEVRERAAGELPQPRDADRPVRPFDLTELDTRILTALRPGKRFTRHYTHEDLKAALGLGAHESLTYQLDRLRQTGYIAREPWGQHGHSWRLAGTEVDEVSALFAALCARGHHLYNKLHDVNHYRTWPTVTDCERELGLRNGALYRWLVNHDLFVICPKQGKYRRVPQQVFEHYLERTKRNGLERSAFRPDGYVSLGKAQGITGGCPTQLWRAVQRGDVRAVKVGVAWYYCQVDVERMTDDLKNKPLPGYESIRERCAKVDADRTACADWFHRHGYEVRKFRAPDKQLVNYALTRDLDVWEEGYLADRRHSLTMEQAREVKRRKAEGVPALARAFEVDPNTIRQILLGNTYHERELEAAA